MTDEQEQPKAESPNQPQQPQSTPPAAPTAPVEGAPQPITAGPPPAPVSATPAESVPQPAAAQPAPAGAAQPQWVQVPQHPYAAPGQYGVPGGPNGGNTGRSTGGRALAIVSMALGLIALFTAIVSALYFSVFILLSGFVGVIALVLGIIALVKKSRPRGASLTGVITGAISLLITLVLGALGLVSLSTNLLGLGAPASDSGIGVAPDGGQGDQGGDQQDGDGGWTPDAEPQALLEWPANMASGGILFEGPGDPLPKEADPLAPGTTPAPSAVDRDNANDILIYVDYTCPHCAAFEQTNGDFLEGLIEAGDATVEVVPLSFLDRATGDSYYSSRAAGAIACLVDEQPEAAWDGHKVLLDPNLQPNGTAGMTNEQIADALDAAAGGLKPAARNCITSERFVSFAQSLNQWVFANVVPNAVVENTRVEGTPSVFVNGVLFQGSLENASAFETFFKEQSN